MKFRRNFREILGRDKLHKISKKVMAMAMSLAMLFQTADFSGLTSSVSAASITSDSYYVIIAKSSGMAMTVQGCSQDNNAAIIQLPAENYASQVWQLVNMNNGYYEIKNFYSGKVINVPYASTDQGTEMIQFADDGADNAQWSFTEQNGYYRITPKQSSAYGLNVYGNSKDAGAAIIQYNYSGAANELWELKEISYSDIKSNPDNGSSSNWSVTSPDGGTSMYVSMSSSGALTYTAFQDGENVVETSDLGINTSIADFTTGLTYKYHYYQYIDETYSMLSGIKDEYTNRCYEKTIVFTKNNIEFDLVMRAYDDGIAFRYVIKNGNSSMTVSNGGEITAINLTYGSKLWYMPRSNASFMYENNYEESTVGELATGTNLSMPMLFKTGNKYGLIMEADRHGTYVGSVLNLEADGILRTKFDLAQSGDVTTSTPFKSPWRTVIIGNLAQIASNTMVENLSPDRDEDTYNFEDWVDPGVASWSWVSYYGGQEDPEVHKKFIDLASDMGWKYYILDEGWQPSSSTSGSRYEGFRDWFDEIKAYADDKNVKLFVWVDKLDVDTDEEREARFKAWSEAGIVGIKVDFFYNENQSTLQLHDDIYADAAKYHLMVNVHGSNPPSGEVRTYPNVIAREAVCGQEQGGITCEQYTIIPFIRAAVGTVDVTEQLYSRDTSKTTMGFQIALSVLFENGIHSLGSQPSNYYSIPAAVSYYTNFPSRWDDMYVIEDNTNIDDQVNFARRSGTSWYSAGISVTERDINYKPAFLDKDKTYTAVIYKEPSGQRQNLEMQVINGVTSTTDITVHVQAGGGYAIKFISETGAVDRVTTSVSNMTLSYLDSKNVTLNFEPEGTNATDVKWTVADDSIVQLSTTARGATIKGIGVGTTKVYVTSVFDETIKATINVTVKAGKYMLDTDTWQIFKNDYSYVINSENSVTITAKNGVINRNIFAMEADDSDFEIQGKISGGLSADYQGGFIGVFDEDQNPYVSVGRRYHSIFSTDGDKPYNHIAMMNNGGEAYYSDTNYTADVYVKLVKSGDTFTGYYRYNESDAWTLAGTMAKSFGSSKLYVGFYACTGGGSNETDIMISEFKYNGNAVNIAKKQAAEAAVSDDYTKYEAEDASLGGGANILTDDNASLGKYVGNVGVNSGTISFKVKSIADEDVNINIFYATYVARSLKASVNGMDYSFSCASTGGWNVVGGPISFNAHLVKGENVITLSGLDGGYAPNIDYIEISQSVIKVAEELVINGYQISPNKVGVRTCYSAESKIDGLAVEEVGLIYGLEGRNSADDMYIGTTDTKIYSYCGTAYGKTSQKFSASDTAQNYVMTMRNISGSSEEYTQNFLVRVYAKLSDGSYRYSNIGGYSTYDIADYMYQNKKMPVESWHTALYENILKVVNPNYGTINF